jgi:hypothetical protein
MIAKKLKAKIDKKRNLVLHLSDIAPGEVEVIILQEERSITSYKDLLLKIPKHKTGKIQGTLSRKEIYSDAR